MNKVVWRNPYSQGVSEPLGEASTHTRKFKGMATMTRPTRLVQLQEEWSELRGHVHLGGANPKNGCDGQLRPEGRKGPDCRGMPLMAKECRRDTPINEDG